MKITKNLKVKKKYRNIITRIKSSLPCQSVQLYTSTCCYTSTSTALKHNKVAARDIK